MTHRPGRPAAALLIALCCTSCSRGPQYYPVRGQVLANGKPADGALIVFHPDGTTDPHALRPSATVRPDGSFELQTYVAADRAMKDGAPAGPYQVTCVWFPAPSPNAGENALKVDVLPDKLGRRYADPGRSGLRAEVLTQPTELPPFKLETAKP
jgi:hypothetical protein